MAVDPLLSKIRDVQVPSSVNLGLAQRSVAGEGGVTFKSDAASTLKDEASNKVIMVYQNRESVAVDPE